MKKGKITIHDISKHLGIDSSTVSRALNDSERVSKKTKALILNTASEMGYQRNSLASKLRTNKSNTIGVVVPRISRHFFSSVIAGIEETAYDAGFDVMICQSLESLEREKNLVETLSSNRVDGVLISISMETTSFSHFDAFENHGAPIIFFDRPCRLERNTNVIIDDYKASFEATEHLIGNGRRHIVHLSGPQNLELYRNRKAGYMDALKKHNLVVDASYIFESQLMKEDGEELAQKILAIKKADAVFSANDTAAISAIQCLKEMGKKIPEDLAFVGFSNEPISAVIEPSLTTMSQPDFEMGKVATSLLLKQIKGEKLNEIKVLKPTLIVRDSSK
mgnify:CR=1 FL=1